MYFIPFPVAGVAIFKEIRHILIWDIFSQMVRAFISYSFPVAGIILFKAFEVFMVK